MLRVTTFTVGQMATNCYLLSDSETRECVIVDPGDDAEYISDRITTLGLTPTHIIATHGHFDHIMAAFVLKINFDIPFLIHEKDRFLVNRMQSTAKHFLDVGECDPPPSIDRTIEHGDILDIGHIGVAIWALPGHTPGGIGLYEKKSGIMLTGDTLFADGAVGRTDHEYADRRLLKTSISKILHLPVFTRLLPGHGEESTVGAEVLFHVQ